MDKNVYFYRLVFSPLIEIRDFVLSPGKADTSIAQSAFSVSHILISKLEALKLMFG